ncbi:GNAT family N-acetyltransferase [Lutimaribacter marinistellae]|uniref:GNAT family N-acetyltransferase n=1 Tax=Lutimaribacter marinistellae TaxID=1820329 RepID=A0ABV7TP47_9RHOB
MIRTRRLLLRSGRSDDLDPLHEIFSDPRAMRYWDRPPHTELSETRSFLERFMTGPSDDRFEFILDLDGRCIGKAGVWGAPEIGYILQPDLWGRGLAHEALCAVLPRAFERFSDLPELTAQIDPRNTASEKLLRKLGFRQTAYVEQNFLYGENEWCDSAYFAVTREELQT